MWAHRCYSRVTEKIQGYRNRRLLQRNAPNQDDENGSRTQHPNTTTEGRQFSEGRRQQLSFLYSLCQRWAWGAIEFRCETHPQEADISFVDRHGSTALHWVVFGNPPATAIEALIHACPALAYTRNRLGQLPIHLAAQFRASGDVLRVLMRAYPQGALLLFPPRMGEACVMHMMADRGNAFDAFRAMLEFREGAASLKLSQTPIAVCRTTPLALLNTQISMIPFHASLTILRDIRRTEDLFRRALKETGAYNEVGMQRVHDQIETARQDEFWRKAEIMIQVEYTDEPLTDDDTNFSKRIVHAVAGIDYCPSSLAELALLLYREQLAEKDEEGKLPLHIASCDWRKQTLIRDILRAYPEAARIPDKKGKYPFQLLMESSRQPKNASSRPRTGRLLGELFCEHGAVLESMKLDDRLYPYVWQKVMVQELNWHQGIYESLRAKPSIVPPSP